MARLMSVAMTEQAVIERHKTVTRRKGWWVDKNGRHLLKPGDRLVLCRKVMGRKPGEPLVRLAEVEVVDVRREPLRTLLSHRTEWAAREMVREGFPDMNPRVFVDAFFVAAQGMTLDDDVTRIEWRYLPGVGPIRPWTDDTWTPGIDGRRLPDVRRECGCLA